MKKLINLSALLLLALFFIQCDEDYDTALEQEPESITVTDADGNVYRTIIIGNQTWMLENLKTTKFNDGTSIPEYDFTSDENWNKDVNTFPFFQWASTSDLTNSVDENLPTDYYGAMYNHAAIESGKLAPEGWRVPTQQDFEILKNFIANQGYANREGVALKSATGWSEFSGNGLDVFGFNALPGGYVDVFGTPKADSVIGTWATSDFDPVQRRRMILSLHQEEMEILDQSILLGSSIRCIKN